MTMTLTQHDIVANGDYMIHVQGFLMVKSEKYIQYACNTVETATLKMWATRTTEDDWSTRNIYIESKFLQRNLFVYNMCI
jgi:hypothetical protein